MGGQRGHRFEIIADPFSALEREAERACGKGRRGEALAVALTRHHQLVGDPMTFKCPIVRLSVA